MPDGGHQKAEFVKEYWNINVQDSPLTLHCQVLEEGREAAVGEVAQSESKTVIVGPVKLGFSKDHSC